MLKELYVKDFVLIDDVRLSFCEGMSAFTGETGAGKSLLIDAIALLCGDRIHSAMVKQGRDQAVIEGVFSLPKDHIAFALLQEAGFEIEEDMIIVQRTFTPDGKSSARLNYRTTTLSFLKQVMSSLIDIHSQHDNQYLLNNKYHLTLLDQYLNAGQLAQEIKRLYHDYQRISDELNAALKQDYNEDDLEYLTFQLNEINDAHVQEGELEALEAELKRFMAFEKTSAALAKCLQLLNGDHGANPAVYEAARMLEHAPEDACLMEVYEKLNELYYALEEQYQTLYDYAEQMEYDERRVNEINERIFVIRKLFRKYGGDVQTLLQKQMEIEQRIDLILHRSDYLKKQEAKQQAAYQAFYKQAQRMHELRVTKAKELEAKVVKQLHELQLPNARFVVHFTEISGNAHGMDAVEFLISMNKGEALKPLQTTASGGELSRLMLGLKTIFTTLQGIETVIFDEIDTGVSGSVAFAIGKKMQELGIQTQVFCVTHLAQVAACAKHHYLVEKHQTDNSTTTQIRELNNAQRIQELAMIASDSTSASALSAAKELYQKAHA